MEASNALQGDDLNRRSMCLISWRAPKGITTNWQPCGRNRLSAMWVLNGSWSGNLAWHTISWRRKMAKRSSVLIFSFMNSSFPSVKRMVEIFCFTWGIMMLEAVHKPLIGWKMRFCDPKHSDGSRYSLCGYIFSYLFSYFVIELENRDNESFA